jgi:hypothetical protein
MESHMSRFGHIFLHAAIGGVLLVPAAFAQTMPQQSGQDASQGVSHPPADDTIAASPDMDNAAPVTAPKPSAAVPATPPPVSQPAPVAAAAPSAENPDYGIVTSVVPSQTESTAAASSDASLQKRPWNPDDDIVHVIPSSPNELAEGTNIRVRLSQQLSTTETTSGQPFKGIVAFNVYKDGRIIIPAGSELRGRVAGVSQGHHLGNRATLRLRPELVLLPDGTAYHLYAQVIQSQAPGTRTDSEGGIQPSSQIKKEAIEYGVGVGAGAVAGAEIAGPHGAIVGGLVGAGVVTAHLLIQHPHAATVPEGSTVIFSLTEPMALTPTRN